MKKVIKHGRKPEPISTIKQFQCITCGCVFECDKEDYRRCGRYETSTVMENHSDCPECGNLASEVRMR